LKLQGGLAYEYSLVDDQDELTRYGLVSVPLSLDWDRRNDALDPSKGWQTFLATAPYQDTLSDLSFIKTLGEGSVHIRLSREPQLVLSTRATLGSITGASVEDVPADKRFYAGGGGTIRGYKYQSVGELDEDGDPVGGNSMATVSFELRSRVSRTIGTALFLDGGTTYPEAVPDPNVDFLWGAGFGLRYFMSFAPLRADIAFPLNRRDEIDAAFQFYISLGQSF
jgi:translocation and assembly module TamA